MWKNISWRWQSQGYDKKPWHGENHQRKSSASVYRWEKPLSKFQTVTNYYRMRMSSNYGCPHFQLSNYSAISSFSIFLNQVNPHTRLWFVREAVLHISPPSGSDGFVIWIDVSDPNSRMPEKCFFLPPIPNAAPDPRTAAHKATIPIFTERDAFLISQNPTSFCGKHPEIKVQILIFLIFVFFIVFWGAPIFLWVSCW